MDTDEHRLKRTRSSVFLCVHRWLTDFFNNPSSKRLARDLLLLAAFTLALHAPFLRQPVQGDEVNYLDMAAHVLQQPLTPLNFEFVSKARWWMRRAIRIRL